MREPRGSPKGDPGKVPGVTREKPPINGGDGRGLSRVRFEVFGEEIIRTLYESLHEGPHKAPEGDVINVPKNPLVVDEEEA
jgi:hypothetical protein